jgi:hypothetical protein
MQILMPFRSHPQRIGGEPILEKNRWFTKYAVSMEIPPPKEIFTA